MLLAFVKNLFGRKGEEERAVPLTDMSDEDLMVAYRDGDVAAFEVLVKRHERGIFNFIVRSTGRRDLAEELLQEVFLRIVKSAPKYEQTAKFTTWAYTIARNICIDRARKAKKYNEVSLDKSMGGDEGEGQTFKDALVDEESASSEVELERKEFIKRLKAALDELPEDQRDVFVMREFSGLKFREIADILEIPVPTVKSRMRYALESLRGHLQMYEGHSFDREDRKIAQGSEG